MRQTQDTLQAVLIIVILAQVPKLGNFKVMLGLVPVMYNRGLTNVGGYVEIFERLRPFRAKCAADAIS